MTETAMILNGTLLRNMDLTGEKGQFDASDVKRWGTVRRSGNRTYMLVAELCDDRVFQVAMSDNLPHINFLREKRKRLPVFDRGIGWAGHRSGIRVHWDVAP